MSDKLASVREIPYSEVEGYLPPVEPFDWDGEFPDVLICALGFEDRTRAIVGRLAQTVDPSKSKHPLAVYCEYQTNNEDNAANRGPLLALLNVAYERSVSVTADDPASLRARMLDELSQVATSSAKPISVMVDISAAAGSLILTLCAVLTEFSATHRMRLRVAYAEAGSYEPSKDAYEVNGEQLVLKACSSGDASSLHEFGVAEVEINELYPGSPQEGREELIIALPAYRTERLSRCLRRVSSEPILPIGDHVHWILGEPPANELAFRLEFQKRVITRLLVGESEAVSSGKALTSENMSVTSTLHYQQTTRRIVEIVDAHLGHTLSLVHMGSKMQGLGAGLALAVRSEVTVCYARPTRFNPKLYSCGIGPMWQVDFSDFGVVVDMLRTVGRLQMTTAVETVRSGLPAQ
ncbi:hypothetical protein [Variovorax sp. MHTC-1]|uniref:hypothetical protein n=1 Tax=Variovorax sp. MHTC-1 TaxID=2495593 RepID=UPI000F8703EF|nr:hypothetical protein [Variovorax sp. MHTC-1]RST52637.1 hypothetical protein EJI01_15620 [Variovorax sp. MHTC-1]